MRLLDVVCKAYCVWDMILRSTRFNCVRLSLGDDLEVLLQIKVGQIRDHLKTLLFSLMASQNLEILRENFQHSIERNCVLHALP